MVIYGENMSEKRKHLEDKVRELHTEMGWDLKDENIVRRSELFLQIFSISDIIKSDSIERAKQQLLRVVDNNLELSELLKKKLEE